MLLYPNAKINIGLNITSKIKSGYHSIESCFCPVSLYDIVEIKESHKNNFSTSGITIDGKKSNNIVHKAIKIFRSDKKFNIHLHKNIPIGAGLGGGSSDGSSILKFLNNKFPKYNQNELLSESNKIGSDCPFFIHNKVKYVTGTGNIFEEIKLDLTKKQIIIVNPKESINTAEAFKNIYPNKPRYNLKEVLENENLENWKKFLKNDFENYAFTKIKILQKIKDHLTKIGAKYVSLSGSGSCLYGVFNKEDLDETEINFSYYSVKALS